MGLRQYVCCYVSSEKIPNISLAEAFAVREIVKCGGDVMTLKYQHFVDPRIDARRVIYTFYAMEKLD